MARKPGPGRRSGVTWNAPANAWTDRFYNDPAYTVSANAEEVAPPSSLAEFWESLPEWSKDHALKEQTRIYGGKAPECKGCGDLVITYPFHCIESWGGVLCIPCDRKRYPVRPPVVLSTTDPDAWEWTHRVRCYGYGHERVRIIADETHEDYGFRYGEMHIEYLDQREVKARWISFGRTNFTHLEARVQDHQQAS